MEIIFKADKKHRDKYFSAGSFAHPAKMMLPLQRWIIEKYSKPGDVILDPMAGQGTLLVACTMGRHVIMVELESKFVQMQRDNWTKIQTLGPEMGYLMGTATILQGDARQLPDILTDVIISSPPYGNRLSDVAVNDGDPQRMGYRQSLADVVITSPPYEAVVDGTGEGPSVTSKRNKSYKRMPNSYTEKADVIMTSPPYAETLQRWGNTETETMKKKGLHQENKEGIGSFPYGNIDCVITSPPYEGSDVSQTHMTSDHRGDPSDPNYRPSWKTKLEQGYAETKRPYADCVITSPPYDEGTGHGRGSGASNEILETKNLYLHGVGSYGESKGNIGNLKGDSYLSAMLEVYQGCRRVLKPQGLMVLVTKNFIRDKLEVRLDLDTIKLCEQAGFQFVERHYRKLTSQSFWRTIYQQKYPDAPILDKEDILVFRKYGV